jgi:hypothetical protein
MRVHEPVCRRLGSDRPPYGLGFRLALNYLGLDPTWQIFLTVLDLTVLIKRTSFEIKHLGGLKPRLGPF